MLICRLMKSWQGDAVDARDADDRAIRALFTLLLVTLIAAGVSLALTIRGQVSAPLGALLVAGFFGEFVWLIFVRWRGRFTLAALRPVRRVPNAGSSPAAGRADHWIHWRYPPEQWKQWTELQFERMKASPEYSLEKIRPLLPVLFGLTVVAAAAVVMLGGPWRERAIYALLLLVAVLGALVGAVALGRRLPVSRRDYRLRVTPEAYAGPDGLLTDGIHTPWGAPTIWLAAAFVDESPPRNLVFRFNNSLGERIDRCVLIPTAPALASDIARVQHELSLACPNARIMLRDPVDAPAITLRRPIGITTSGDVFTPLVPAGQHLPWTHSQTFGNATNGAGEVAIDLSQHDAIGTNAIANLRIPIPRAANRTLEVTVMLEISADKAMQVKTTVGQASESRAFGPYQVE
jgi:hypothetical protein